jgi:exonuclease SbcC
MNSYPKIYSLSTVGVRQHNNVDYLLHPVRTDFTGDNGLGKSIVADLMQLILIPKRDLWKPGTEGLDKNERRIEGIPLNKTYIDHAYAFFNIERAKGKFVTIGVYIPKNSRYPVRPFIIQKNADFSKKELESFDRPLHATDFLAPNKTVMELKELKNHLTLNFDIYLYDYFQHEEIMNYYETLFTNHIIPIDLTKETNLKALAKILQSFSRAKTLDVTNSRSLQNFLFEDNDEIKTLFEEQKDQLENYIKQYNASRDMIKELDQKQTKLTQLKKMLDKSIASRDEFLTADTIHAYNFFIEAQRNFNENKTRFEGAIRSLDKNKKELKSLTENTLRGYQDLHAVNNHMQKYYEDLIPTLSDRKIEEKRNQANELFILVNELEKLAPIFKRYMSAQAAQEKMREQEKYRDRKVKLKQLQSIRSYADFEKSEWASDFKSALNNYPDKVAELPRTIEQLSSLLELYEKGNANSLFHWAVNEKKPLSVEEESVLMHLKDIATNKPTGKGADLLRYTVNPKKLITGYEEDKEGNLWVVLGEIREYVPRVTRQKFDDAKKLKTVLEKDRKEILQNLKDAEEELTLIRKLNIELLEIGYNADMFEAYKERKKIEAYEIDEDLTKTILEAFQENEEQLGAFDELQRQYQNANREALRLAQQQTESKLKLEQILDDNDKCKYEINKLKDELPYKVEWHKPKFEELSVEDILKQKSALERKVEEMQPEKEAAVRNQISIDGVVKACQEKDPQLKLELEKTQAVFDEKRADLEKDTNLKWEDLPHLGDYTNTRILQLAEKSVTDRRNFENEFTRIAQSFDETKDNKNQELETDKFNFQTLVNVLCGKLGLEGIGPELLKLNEELKKFGDLQLTIILNVFDQVARQYQNFRKLITELNFFFQENRISNNYQFRIEFLEKKEITIEWIRKMREKAKVQKFGADLFTEIEDIDKTQNSPEKLIVNIAKTFSTIKNCELSDLLNPKFYFELKVGLFDDSGIKYTGSGGQAYTALALLCIGRLSVIQKDKSRPGVKFIIIEELSNIDDLNFNLFPQIAGQFGYQLITMTPKPFGSYTDEDWFLHMLIRGKDKDINYSPMSFFKTRNSKKLLNDFIEPKQTS